MAEQRPIPIPEPTADPESLLRTCLALKEAVEVLQGIRGSRRAVTQEELNRRLAALENKP